MATNDRGLGSDNMSQTDKDKIHSMGGKASHATGTTGKSASTSRNVTTNKKGGGALDKAAQRKGGKTSHRG